MGINLTIYPVFNIFYVFIIRNKQMFYNILKSSAYRFIVKKIEEKGCSKPLYRLCGLS